MLINCTIFNIFGAYIIAQTFNRTKEVRTELKIKSIKFKIFIILLHSVLEKCIIYNNSINWYNFVKSIKIRLWIIYHRHNLLWHGNVIGGTESKKKMKKYGLK